MKKKYALLLAALLLLLPAFALGDTAAPEETAEFFTWSSLATYGGAMVAVMLIVQFTKGFPGIGKLPTRLWAYIVALVVLIVSTLFTETVFSVKAVLLCFINAAVVAAAAIGSYDTMTNTKPASTSSN